jgi:CHAT domain-containing protein/Tfp pilus assembly protein PilF
VKAPALLRIRPILLLFVFILIGASAAGADPMLDHYQRARHLAAAGDYPAALENAQQALRLGRQEIGDTDPRLAPLLNEVATLLYGLGRYAEAADYFETALDLKEKQFPPDDPQLALAMINLAAAYGVLGRLQDAETFQRKALVIDQQARGPESLAVGEDMNNLAGTLQAKGDYREAHELLQRALTIFQAAGNENHSRLAGLHNNLALLEKLQGRFATARNHYREALGHAVAGFGQEHPETAKIVGNLATLLSDTGDFQEAERYFQRSLAIYKHDPGARYQEMAAVLNAFGSFLRDRNRLTDAHRLYSQALQMQLEALGARHSAVAALYNNLGELELAQGNLAEAEGHLQQALQIWDEAEEAPALWIASARNNLGQLHARRGQWDDAEKELRQALAAMEPLGKDHYQHVQILANLANALKFRGAPDAAALYLKQACDIAARTLPPRHPQQAELLNSLAAFYFGRGELGAAEETSRQATAVVLARLQQPSADRSERILLRHILLNRVELLAQLAQHHPGQVDAYNRQAFDMAQWAYVSRAGQAFGQLAERYAAGDNRLAHCIRRRQDSLLRHKYLESMLTKSLILPGDPAAACEQAEIRRQIALVETDLAADTVELNRDFAGYAALETPRVLDAAHTQALLGPHEALALFLTGESAGYVWLVRPHDLIMQRISLSRNELTALVDTLRRGLNQSDVIFADEIRPFDLAIAHRLYNHLIAPLESRLQGVTQLLTVVDDALLTLPFSVLVGSPDTSPTDDSDRYRRADWLINHLMLSRLPTVAALADLRQAVAPSAAPLVFAAFGDPQLTDIWGNQRGPGARGGSTVSPADVKSLARLPETAEELQTVARILGSPPEHLFLGAAATEAQVNAMRLQDYRILAFASHALVAGDLPGLQEPALVLTPPEAKDASDDGLLTATEITRLSLDADLVILSACNSAAADGSADGEGLSGLARAFIYAGSRSLLVSHWPVSSTATKTLMTRFFEDRQSDPQKNQARALANAMQAMLSGAETEFAHPMFWAPFMVIGAHPID